MGCRIISGGTQTEQIASFLIYCKNQTINVSSSKHVVKLALPTAHQCKRCRKKRNPCQPSFLFLTLQSQTHRTYECELRTAAPVDVAGEKNQQPHFQVSFDCFLEILPHTKKPHPGICTFISSHNVSAGGNTQGKKVSLRNCLNCEVITQKLPCQPSESS